MSCISYRSYAFQASCKEFSRLKLKWPGPKALRTPQHMDGVPGLSPAEQARVDASAEIRRRSSTLLRAVFSTAGHAGLEQPPSAMSWLQEDNIAMLREWSAHVAYVSACSHGLGFYKNWAFCASFESIASLASVCTHSPGTHRSIAGKQLHGKVVSELTAEYPSSLAAQLAHLMRPFVSSNNHQNAPLSDFADFLTEDFVPRRMKLVDGAGMNSTADHTTPHSIQPHPLASAWLQWFVRQSPGV